MKKLFLAILIVSFTVSCAEHPSVEKKRTYRIGYMICNSEYETLHRFRPLTAYLGRKLGINLEAVAIDTVDFTKEVDKLDFTHTNSLLYIIMNRNHGVEIVAAEKAGSLGARSRGAIIVLKKSGIRNLKDLKGKTMLFGPMLGPTSYMTQLDLLLRSGIDPDNDLASYSIPSGSYKHEKVIYGILLERYNAGAVPVLDFERMVKEGKIDPNDFSIIAEGEPIPYCNFSATQRVDESLARKFRKALLAIRQDDTADVDGEVIRVLDRAQIEGYEDVRDSDFNPIREMAKRTNMPPYQRF